MKYKPDQIQTHEIKDATLEKGKFTKKVVHVAAGAPDEDDDTGSGFEQGSIWVDTTNGEMYLCSDHSAEDATWLNMEGDDVNPPFTIQGENYGWLVGGPGTDTQMIQRYPFSAPSDSADVDEAGFAVLNSVRGSVRDDSYGYQVGGNPASGMNIWRYPFAATTSLADVGEIVDASPPSATVDQSMGASSGTYGFIMGGKRGSPQAWSDMVQKITLASPAPSVDTGAELSEGRYAGFGLSDITNSYMVCYAGSEAVTPSTPAYGLHVDTIEKGAFTVSSGTLTDVGNAQNDTYSTQGSQSTTYGYQAGGFYYPPAIYYNVIEKYPFSSGGNAADVGDLLSAVHSAFAASSTTHGWSSGGKESPGSQEEEVASYTYTSDANAADQGELTQTHEQGGYNES